MPKQNRREFLINSVPVAATGLLLPHVLAEGVIALPDRKAVFADGFARQAEWRFCGKCFNLFWNGSQDKGRCAGGGGHVMGNGSFNFFLEYDANTSYTGKFFETSIRQMTWRFCQKCHVMFYDGFPGKGSCAAGGAHSAYGYNFRLPHEVPGNSANQAGWRYCQKCYGMFWNGWNPKGSCPAGAAHSAYGYNFSLPIAADNGEIRIRNNVTTNGWAPIGGWVEVAAKQDGSCSFSGHVHNSGGVNIRFTLAAVLLTPSGYSYGFANVGKRVDGTQTLFDRNRDNNWNQAGANADIALNWHEVARSQLHWRLVASSDVTSGIRNYLEKMVIDVYNRLPGGYVKSTFVGEPLLLVLTL